MGYKILGFAVWKGAKWFVRRRVNTMVSSKGAAAGVVVVVVAGLAVASARRDRASA